MPPSTTTPRSSAQNPIISLDDVFFAYQKQPVLEKINLKIKVGEFVGILGPNGSGKTTLLKIMIGLLKPDDGQVKLFGQTIRSFKDWYKVGYIPQKVSQQESSFPITVEEVVQLGCVASRSWGRRLTATDHRAVAQALETVKMSDFKHRQLTQLSGGQLQRVFIAKALVAQPKLLILDEPTVGVDPVSQATFYELLSTLNRDQGLTIILVSHDIDVVTQQVQKVVCINRELIFDGTSHDFIHGEHLAALYGEGKKFIKHQH